MYAQDPETMFTLVYVVVAGCLVAPPTEFVSAGLTVQNLLSNFLGSEDLNFVYHHIRRTTCTLIFHAFIPFGYYVGMGLCSTGREHFFSPWTLSFYWRLYLAVCIILPLCAFILAFYWSRKRWGNHHISKALQAQAPRESSWHAVASSINIEFRRIDKFTTGTPGRRLIVTDTWIMQTSTYNVNIAHQGDIHLSLTGTDEHELSHESTTGVQFLNIMVISSNHYIKPFKIRLNAMEYSDLRGKIQSPVVNARNVVIQQSLSDRFLEAFRMQIGNNEAYRNPPDMELEPCIGCMQTPANVKLMKLCDNLSDGDCQQCYCRPMWCLECMGKWFVSRQEPHTPEQWMVSKSPCPTCRARFCMLDVCHII